MLKIKTKKDENNVKNMQKIEEKLLGYQAEGELDRVIVRVPGFGGTGGIAIVGLLAAAEISISNIE